jgi:hypothetical protein
MLTARILGMVVPFLLAGCSQLSDLPPTANAAFALKDVPRSGNTLMETFTVKATVSDALKAAEYALASSDFEARPVSWTNEKRCGEYTTGWYDWAMWGCFYFQPAADGMLRGRVIVESWNSFGVTTRQPWYLHLTNAFQNRLRSIQGLTSQ